MDKEATSTLTIADFVKETITQIAVGLQSAQKEGESHGVKIFPWAYGNKTQAVNIAFDLAVAQRAESGKDGHFALGVPIAHVEFGGGKGEKMSADVSNRVQFTLPIDFTIYNAPNSRAPEASACNRDYDPFTWGKEK